MSFKIQKIFRHVLAHEDNIPHMYADVYGNVTVGVGCLLETAEEAMSLPFQYKKKKEFACPETIRHEWEELTEFGNPAGKYRHTYYRRLTSLKLSDEAREALFKETLQKFVEDAKRILPDFWSYDGMTQAAIVDIFYNRGSARAANMLVPALTERDWTAAAAECRKFADKHTFEGLKKRYNTNAGLFLKNNEPAGNNV